MDPSVMVFSVKSNKVPLGCWSQPLWRSSSLDSGRNKVVFNTSSDRGTSVTSGNKRERIWKMAGTDELPLESDGNLEIVRESGWMGGCLDCLSWQRIIKLKNISKGKELTREKLQTEGPIPRQIRRHLKPHSQSMLSAPSDVPLPGQPSGSSSEWQSWGELGDARDGEWVLWLTSSRQSFDKAYECIVAN